ncbi:MAG: cell division protein FtsH, partial [Candidatus Margulisiibacteriota bacterium]
LAAKMVCEYGMSRLGPRTFGRKDRQIFLGRDIGEMKDYSDQTADKIDAEVQSILDECYKAAKALLQFNKEKLVEISKGLMEKESLENHELEAALKDLKNPNVQAN